MLDASPTIPQADSELAGLELLVHELGRPGVVRRGDRKVPIERTLHFTKQEPFVAVAQLQKSLDARTSPFALSRLTVVMVGVVVGLQVEPVCSALL